MFFLENSFFLQCWETYECDFLSEVVLSKFWEIASEVPRKMMINPQFLAIYHIFSER